MVLQDFLNKKFIRKDRVDEQMRLIYYLLDGLFNLDIVTRFGDEKHWVKNL